MPILLLLTSWDPPEPTAEGYWHRTGVAQFTRDQISPNVLGLKGDLSAIGAYIRIPGRKDYTNLSPAYLKVSNIRYDERQRYPLTMQIEFKGDELGLPSYKFTEKLYEIAKPLYRGQQLLCFTLEYKDWERIKEELNLKPPNWWVALIKGPPPLLGEYFLNLKKCSWREYEERVATCFHILGFRVRRLGHKKRKERVPDGYLYTPPGFRPEDSFWITYDCKAKENYPSSDDNPAEDERRLIEYIREEERVAGIRGVNPNRKYFIFVAHSFTTYAKKMCINIQTKTAAIGGLMTTDALLRLIEKRFKYGYRFTLAKFSDLMSNEIIDITNVEKVYPPNEELMFEE
jgi:hypothetical protein